MNEIQQKTETFVSEIKGLIFEETKRRVAAAVQALPASELLEEVTPFGGSVSLKGLDYKIEARGVPKRAKGKKRIVKANMVQWQCPVPGCKGKAAPVFGMVCGEHKNLPKAQIKKFRAARKAAKTKGAK